MADTYSDILPEVAQILEDTVKTTGTLEEKEAALDLFLRDVRSFSDTARVFLEDNEENLEDFADLSATQLRVLARYSPLLRCLPQGIEVAQGRLAEAFRGFELHIILETLPNQPRPYDADDRPRFGADNDPDCLGLPNPEGSQAQPFDDLPNFDDGVDEPTGKGTVRVAPELGGDAGRTAFTADPTDMSLLRDFLGDSYAGAGDLDLLLGAPALASGGDR